MTMSIHRGSCLVDEILASTFHDSFASIYVHLSYLGLTVRMVLKTLALQEITRRKMVKLVFELPDIRMNKLVETYITNSACLYHPSFLNHLSRI